MPLLQGAHRELPQDLCTGGILCLKYLPPGNCLHPHLCPLITKGNTSGTLALRPASFLLFSSTLTHSHHLSRRSVITHAQNSRTSGEVRLGRTFSVRRALTKPVTGTLRVTGAAWGEGGSWGWTSGNMRHRAGWTPAPPPSMEVVVRGTVSAAGAGHGFYAFLLSGVPRDNRAWYTAGAQ